MGTISMISINYSDLNDGVCIALGSAGLVPLYIGLIEKMKDCTADHKQYVVCLICSKYYGVINCLR